MDVLLKQMRVRFSGVEQGSQQDPNSTRERRIPLQKTSSFKGDRKKQQNWFRRQFSRETSRDYGTSDDGEYATAIAAAAFAINSLEEAELVDKKKIREGLEKFPTRSNSKKEGAALQPDAGRISRRFTGKQSKADEQLDAGRISRRFTERVDQRIPEIAVTSEKKPQEAPSRVPTIKRKPTTAEEVDTQPRPIPLPTAISSLPAAGDDKWRESSTRTGPQSKADAWMEAKMAKIQKSYDKMNSTILSWEDEKKKKAKHQLNMKESKLEQRRARALQQFRIEMTRIDQVVGGARTQVEERKRMDELKAKEKADKIRATGKVPATCFCC
ncbi:remorin 1.4-like [Macadamia integrifolia]|uniref:remorin 1.4-like n=1 Tax=Macadamia integrifolia TaxID=60698 RepID=UPI001C4F4EC1|nr:remorin 1.4-like [Macadamia integrifolia]